MKLSKIKSIKVIEKEQNRYDITVEDHACYFANGILVHNTDGQAIAISWKNGQLISARNKSQIMNFGENAMNVEQTIKKFAGRGALSDSFKYAIEDLSSAISKLTDKQKEKIFGDGKRFVHLEIIWPETTNVIPYNSKLLVFHNVREYNENGNVISGDFNETARMLSGMIRQINQDTQLKFKIKALPLLNLKQVINYREFQQKYISELENIKKSVHLSDKNTIKDYYYHQWARYLMPYNKQYSFSNKQLFMILRRLMNDKNKPKLSEIFNSINNKNFEKWFTNFEKNEKDFVMKDFKLPLELLFLKVGTTVLENISTFLTVNPSQASMKIKNDLDNTIKDIQNSNNVNMLNKLNFELNRLNSIGGINKIVPTEGILFTYNNKIYKLTGKFAVINQILGIQKYNRVKENLKENNISKSIILKESGIENIKNIAKQYKYFELYFHQDLDGVFTAVGMKEYLKQYGLKLKNAIPIQYGKQEYETKKPDVSSDTMAVLVDFAHGHREFKIHIDHHDTQTGIEAGTSTQFKHAASNTETLSGLISSRDIYPASDIKYINMIDNAEFLNNKVSPKDLVKSIFKKGKTTGESKKNMILVVNRLLSVYKNKNDFMVNIVKDSSPSIYNIYLNCVKYSKNLNSTPDLKNNADKYVRELKKYSDLNYEDGIIIQRSLNVGLLKQKGSYDRYAVFRVFPDATFLISDIMGNLQVSENGFKVKVGIDLSELSKKILDEIKPIIDNAYTKIRYIKAYSAHGATENSFDFKWKDLISMCGYENIKGLNKDNEKKVKELMDKVYGTITDDEKDYLDNFEVKSYILIEKNSGGHPSITNVGGLKYIADVKLRIKFIDAYIERMKNELKSHISK